MPICRSMESISDPETVCEHLFCHDPVNRQSDPGLFTGSLCVCQTEVSREKSAVSADPQHDDDPKCFVEGIAMTGTKA